MNKKSLKGIRHVFRFTCAQNIKSKGIKITTILICIIVLCSMPIMHLLSSPEASKSDIKKIIVWDESGLNLGDFSGMAQNETYKDVQFESASSEVDITGNELLLNIRRDENGYILRYIAAADGTLDEMSMMQISGDFEAEFSTLRERAMGLTNEQLDELHVTINSDVTFLQEDGGVPEKNEEYSMEHYNLSLALIVILIMLISFSAEGVSTSTVAEKENKLVENLMMSVSPKALIFGKVGASIFVVVLQMLLMFVCAGISSVLTMLLFGLDKIEIPAQISQVLNSSSMPGLNVINVILALTIFSMGVIFYAFVSGLFGALISKIEDMGEGMKLYNILLVLGAYCSLGIQMAKMTGSDIGMLEKVASFVPLCSPFIVPFNLLIGKASSLMGVMVLLVGILANVLMGLFVAKVYQVMLLHKGSKVKLSEVIKMVQKEGTQR